MSLGLSAPVPAADAQAASAGGPDGPGGPTRIAWIWPVDRVVPPGVDEAAVLVESLEFRGTGVRRSVRGLALNLRPGLAWTPVVHVEWREDPDPARQQPAAARFSAAQQAAVLAAFRRPLGVSGSGWRQLDFEVPTRWAPAYRALVAELRRQMPAGEQLSVTALASWCVPGGWIEQVGADEVVPMLYGLGPEAEAWRQRWQAPATRLARACQGAALGLSTREPVDPALWRAVRRVYWFQPHRREDDPPAMLLPR